MGDEKLKHEGDANYWKTRYVLLESQHRKAIELLKDSHPFLAGKDLSLRVGSFIVNAISN